MFSLRARSIALALLCATFASCATFYDVQYVPAPLEVKVEDGATPGLSGRALITVSGVRRPADDHPAQFELNMRVECIGPVPFIVDPQSFELVTADLFPVGKPAFVPAPPPEIATGTTANFQIVFPLEGPIDNRDLSGLNLRWAVTYESRRMVLGAGFTRIPPPRVYYYDYDPFFPSCFPCNGCGIGTFCRY